MKNDAQWLSHTRVKIASLWLEKMGDCLVSKFFTFSDQLQVAVSTTFIFKDSFWLLFLDSETVKNRQEGGEREQEKTRNKGPQVGLKSGLLLLSCNAYGWLLNHWPKLVLIERWMPTRFNQTESVCSDECKSSATHLQEWTPLSRVVSAVYFVIYFCKKTPLSLCCYITVLQQLRHYLRRNF